MYLMETDINGYQIRITFVNAGNISIVKSSAPTDLCVCARKSAPNTIKMLNSFYSQITSQTDWFFVSPTLIWERYIHFVCIIPIWTINQFCKYCRSMGFIAETQTYHQWQRFNLEDLAFFKRKMLKQQQQQKRECIISLTTQKTHVMTFKMLHRKNSSIISINVFPIVSLPFHLGATQMKWLCCSHSRSVWIGSVSAWYKAIKQIRLM